MTPIDLRGPRDDCGPDCDRFVDKWEAWWDHAFAHDPPAMLATPTSRDDYLQTIGAKSRNMLVKASRHAFAFTPIDHDDWLNAIHRINKSKPVRSGGPMRPAYLERPPFIGPAPQLCSRHRHHWIGGFQLIDTSTLDAQSFCYGDLLAYCHLIVANELAIINTVLAHADAMPNGIMNALVADLAARSTQDGMIRYVNYLTLNCPAGLARFKRSVGFQATPIERTHHVKT